MPFQERGAELLAASNERILAWAPGVGKTPVAVSATEKIKARRILVCCPPVAVDVWRQHFLDWSRWKPAAIRVLDAKSAQDPGRFISGDGVRIVPFSRIRPGNLLIDAVEKNSFEVSVLDELHYLKNARAKRTQGTYGPRIDLIDSMLTGCPRIWGLSGTPVLNNAAELWTHLHALRPDLIRLPGIGIANEARFVDRFCVTRDTPYGTMVIGSRNTQELATRIKPLVDRLRLKDAILDMPELRIVDHHLPSDGLDPALRYEIESAVSGLAFDTEVADDEELLEALQAGGVAFSTLRRLIGRAKVPGITALTNDILDDADESEKVLIFCHHKEVIGALATALSRRKPLVITGATTLPARENAIREFQNDPRRRVIILSTDAASEAITLTAGRHVLVAEPSPVPARNLQAIARAHRKGQKDAVLARFLLLDGTLDERLMGIISRKTKDIAEIIENLGTVAVLGKDTTRPQRTAI
jgi:SWI/SNF-related matrix-associated actin-dependent regulator 1 of chromatin subfamily A